MLRSRKFDGAVELGIMGQYAARGDHIAFLWESDEEFRDAVKFLEVGLAQGDHCVIFGHEEANDRVLNVLAQTVDCEEYRQTGQLTVLSGQSTGEAMLAEIANDFQRALKSGPKVLRLLGNIGWGKSEWPDDNSILAFEARVTGAVKSLPAVVVCMYDVSNLPGRILLNGAMETHPLTIRRNLLRENQHYIPIDDFLKAM